MTCYHQSVDGLSNRSKFRYRFYNNDRSFAFWEKKVKEGKLTTKYRFAINDLKLNPILSEVPALYRDHGRLEPKISILYKREVFKNSPYERLTLDSDIGFKASGVGHFEKSLLGYRILELKTQGLVSARTKDILYALNLKEVSISKYVLAINSFQKSR